MKAGRPTQRRYEHKGRVLTATEVAALAPHLSPVTVYARLRRGDTVEEALRPAMSLAARGRLGKAESLRVERGA
jgi:hypothetical protein